MNPFDFIHQAILHSLLFFYNILFQNIGLAIIALTLSIRTLLLPFTIPAIRTQKKMVEIKPHLDKIKAEHKDDKLKQQQEQLKVMQEHGVNPAAGCLPMILQIVILISLYHVFIEYLGGDAQINGSAVQTSFLYLDLSKPDHLFILPVLAGITQFILGAMMTPAQPIPVQSDDKPKEVEQKEDFAATLQAVQGQMLYMAPFMTAIVSLTFPSGLALYWTTANIFSIIQQYFTVGFDHLRSHLLRIKNIVSRPQKG
jgi:YidC/Oxa1 family membrane protein insertase